VLDFTDPFEVPSFDDWLIATSGEDGVGLDGAENNVTAILIHSGTTDSKEATVSGASSVAMLAITLMPISPKHVTMLEVAVATVVGVGGEGLQLEVKSMMASSKIPMCANTNRFIMYLLM